jgi:hypothetical protein
MGGTGDAGPEVEALPDELPHLEPSRQLRAQGQAGVGHQVAVIEGDVEMVGRVRG